MKDGVDEDAGGGRLANEKEDDHGDEHHCDANLLAGRGGRGARGAGVGGGRVIALARLVGVVCK